MADKYEKIKVRAKSGLLVTKFKDKRTGKIYNQRPIFDQTKKYQKGRASLGIDKELIEIQNANRQSLSPYLGLRNTNIGIGSNLKQQISNIETPTGLSNIPKEEGSDKRFNPQFGQVPKPLDQKVIEQTRKASNLEVPVTQAEPGAISERDRVLSQSGGELDRGTFVDGKWVSHGVPREAEEIRKIPVNDQGQITSISENKLANLDDRSNYSAIEWAGKNQSSARNSIARQKYLKRRKALEIGAKGE